MDFPDAPFLTAKQDLKTLRRNTMKMRVLLWPICTFEGTEK